MKQSYPNFALGISSLRTAPAERFCRTFGGRAALAAGFRVAGLAVVLGLLPLSAGCLNPEFVNQAGLGRLYPIAPGNEPFVLVHVINETTATLDVPIVFDDGINQNVLPIVSMVPEYREIGILLHWPLLRLGLGDLDNPFLPTIVATLADGSTSAVPFGREPLEAGVDFDRGDAVVFYINEDSRSPAYITVSVGLIDADSQPATFTRADPFEATRLILALAGF